MFPPQIMDKLLKLKLELAYKGLTIEQARQYFDDIKEKIEPPPQKKRKLIPGKKTK